MNLDLLDVAMRYPKLSVFLYKLQSGEDRSPLVERRLTAPLQFTHRCVFKRRIGLGARRIGSYGKRSVLQRLTLTDLIPHRLEPLVPSWDRIRFVFLSDGFGSIVLPCPHGKVSVEVVVLHLSFARLGVSDQVGSIGLFEVRKGLLRSVLDQLVVSQRQTLTRKYFGLIRQMVDQFLILACEPVVEDLPFAT